MLDIPANCLPDIWHAHARHFPGKPVAIVDDETLSWGQFDRETARVAQGFRRLGLCKGDRVAFLMPTSVDYLQLICGAMRFGLSVVPISVMLSPDQVATLANDSGAAALFVDARCLDLVQPIMERLVHVQAGCWFSDHASDRFRSYREWLRDVPAEPPEVRLDLDDEINIIYSSGTTGLPKGIAQTHRARQYWATTFAIEMGIDNTARTIISTPLYSNGSWIMLHPTLMVGGTVILTSRFEPQDFLSRIERHGATHTFLVPTQFIRLLAETRPDEYDTSSMRMFLTAAAPMRPDTKHRVLERFGPRLHELYGLSEGGAVMIKPSQMKERPTSVGLPVPGFEVRVLDEGDRECPRGVCGELVVHGGWAMRGYHGRPDATQALVWRDERGRSFIRTGDIGKMDEDGFVYIVDRKKDMIISGGFNVFPTDIESVVGEHPAVKDVTVVGLPHRVWGESPVAFVIGHERTSLDAVELREWSNQRLAKTQRLAHVVPVDEFPRNALGKVLKHQLRVEYEALLQAERERA